jgi:glycosyltransferase involved in cell wall biosynthesis
MAPYFSILIPLYNKERYIADTIKSVLAQTFIDFEVIIIDDGSTDGSAEVAASFKDNRIKYFRSENGGVSSARNYAMQVAQGEYFAFLDADDIWKPYHLERIAEAINQFPHLKVFASLIVAENSKGTYMPVFSNLKSEANFETDYFTASFARSILSGSTTVIHRSVPEIIGDFDISLKTFEDIDFWIRIGLHYQIGVINEVTARHVFVPESLSHKKFTMADATYFEKFADAERSNPNAKKMIDINRYALALRCKMAGDNGSYKKLASLISTTSLTWKQRLLLKLPSWQLRLLQRAKQYTVAKF